MAFKLHKNYKLKLQSLDIFTNDSSSSTEVYIYTM